MKLEILAAKAEGQWSVRLHPEGSLEGVNLAPVDAGRGIMARVGSNAEGRAELEELLFTAPEDPANPAWTQALVASWLALNGFADSAIAREGHDHSAIDGKASVTEDDDWWIVKDNVLAQSGAYNGILRTAEAIGRTWRLFEGVPVTHPHPAGLVEDMDLVSGQVRDVRLETVSDALHGGTRIRADYWLAKKPVPGLMIREENVKLNEETVRRVRAGKPVDNSQGYQWRGRERSKGDPSSQDAGQDYAYVMLEQVPDHLAVLLEQEGACPWNRGCGVGRLSPQDARRLVLEAALKRKPKTEVPQDAVGDGDNMACDGTCASHKTLETVRKDLEGLQSAKDKAVQQTEALTTGMADVGRLLGLKAEGLTCEAVKVALKPKLDRLADIEKAEADAHSALVKEVTTLAVKLGSKEKEEALLARYAKAPSDVLLEHRDALKGIVTVNARKPGNPGRFPAQGEQQEDAAPKRRTVGVPTRQADGSTKWE